MHQKNSSLDGAVVQDDATLQQQQKQQQNMEEEEEEEEEEDNRDVNEEEDVEPNDEDDDEMMEGKAKDKLKPKDFDGDEKRAEKKKEGGEEDVDNVVEVPGEFIATQGVQREPISRVNQPENLPLLEAFNEEEMMRRMLQSDALELMEEGGASNVWSANEERIAGLSQDLCEQLRLILEPTMASMLKGDYRTGKRISMRKVIQYIASQFRKDRIWLRRSKPSKRQYSIMISIDDSHSMDFSMSKEMAIDSLAVISGALTKLETGQLGVCSFGKKVSLLHPFERPFTSGSSAEIINKLTFQQKSTSVVEMINSVTKLMVQQCNKSTATNVMYHQLLLILSDGQILENPDKVLPTIRMATSCGLFIVFVVIEHPENKVVFVFTFVVHFFMNFRLFLLVKL